MSRKKTQSEFEKEVYNLYNGDIIVISNYINNNTKIKFKHMVCNNEFSMTPINLFKGNGCPICNRIKSKLSQTKTQEEFEKELYELYNDEYKLVDKYINSRTKIKFIHTKCNKTFLKRPNDILQGSLCPYCKSSKGEKLIRKILLEENIDFEEQFSFSDCKKQRELKFDFKFINKEDEIILLEYDGEFHESNPMSKNNLTLQKERDQIKEIYCRENNIDLIRINYRDFKNIKSILKKELISHKVI